MNPNIITLDASVISESCASFRKIIESLLNCFHDERDSIRQCSKGVIAWLIKTYPSFPSVIKRLSYFHRQELLLFIEEIKGQFDVRGDTRLAAG